MNYDEHIKYLIHDGGAYITYAEPSIGKEYVIPEEIDGYPVTGIGSLAFSECKELEKITIPNTVKRIGLHAFENLKNLKSVTLSHPNEHSDMQAICSFAFSRCESLEEVTCFGDSDLQKINGGAFQECTKLENFSFPKTDFIITDSAFLYTKLYRTLCEEEIEFPSSVFEYYIEETWKFYEHKVDENGNIQYGDITVNWNQEKYDLAYRELCSDFGFYTGFSGLNHFYSDDGKRLSIQEIKELLGEVYSFYDAKIKFTDNDFIEIKGDIDFDGEITLKDLGTLKKYVMNLCELSPMQKVAASTNGEREPDIRDITALNQYLIGVIDTL